MQVKAENFTLLSNIFNKAEKVLILLPENPSLDLTAAGLFLEENLSFNGKKVTLVVDNLPKEFAAFENKIAAKVPPKKLVVSFNWKKNAVDKVSYNLEGDNFNFIVNPLDKKIELEDVLVSHQWDDPDVLITIGINALEDIKGVELSDLQKTTIIDINKGTSDQGFGSLNFVSEQADSFSAVVAGMIEQANISVEKETVGILMEGIKSATQNFNVVHDPASFEAAAFCTRIRGKEDKLPSPVEEKNEQKEEVPAEWLSSKIFKTKDSPNN